MPVMHFKIVNAKNVKIKFKKPPNYGISIH